VGVCEDCRLLGKELPGAGIADTTLPTMQPTRLVAIQHHINASSALV
jgi:hypothetical protein